MTNRHELNEPEDSGDQPNRLKPDMSGVIERKVTAATIAAGLLGGVLAVLNAVQSNPGLIAGLPKSWQGVIFVVVPLILIFLAGWSTPSNRI